MFHSSLNPLHTSENILRNSFNVLCNLENVLPGAGKTLHKIDKMLIALEFPVTGGRGRAQRLSNGILSLDMPSSGGVRHGAAETIQAGMTAETAAGRRIAVPGNLSRDVAVIRHLTAATGLVGGGQRDHRTHYALEYRYIAGFCPAPPYPHALHTVSVPLPYGIYTVFASRTGSRDLCCTTAIMRYLDAEMGCPSPEKRYPVPARRMTSKCYRIPAKEVPLRSGIGCDNSAIFLKRRTPGRIHDRIILGCARKSADF